MVEPSIRVGPPVSGAPPVSPLAWLAVAVLALLSAVLSVLAYRVGYSLDPGGDNETYAMAAKSLVDTGQLLTVSGSPLTLYPPGYPTLLASLSQVTGSIQSAGHVINALSSAGVVVLTFLVALRAIKSSGIALLAASIIAVSTQWLDVSSKLWTEAPFTVALLAAALILVASAQRGSFTWAGIVGYALCVAAAMSLRYVGAYLVFAGGIVAFAAVRGTVRARVAGAALVVVVTSIGPLVLVTRNLWFNGGPAGIRGKSFVTWDSAISGTLGLFGEHFAPARTIGLTTTVGVAVAVVVLIGSWLAVVERNRGAASLALLLWGYWLVVWLTQTFTKVDPPVARFIAPVLGFAAILGLWGGRRIVERVATQIEGWGHASPSPWVAESARRLSRILPSTATAVVLVFGLWSLVRSLQYVLLETPLFPPS